MNEPSQVQKGDSYLFQGGGVKSSKGLTKWLFCTRMEISFGEKNQKPQMIVLKVIQILVKKQPKKCQILSGVAQNRKREDVDGCFELYSHIDSFLVVPIFQFSTFNHNIFFLVNLGHFVKRNSLDLNCLKKKLV